MSVDTPSIAPDRSTILAADDAILLEGTPASALATVAREALAEEYSVLLDPERDAIEDASDLVRIGVDLPARMETATDTVGRPAALWFTLDELDVERCQLTTTFRFLRLLIARVREAEAKLICTVDTTRFDPATIDVLAAPFDARYVVSAEQGGCDVRRTGAV